MSRCQFKTNNTIPYITNEKFREHYYLFICLFYITNKCEFTELLKKHNYQ